jgi:hypothetical protein
MGTISVRRILTALAGELVDEQFEFWQEDELLEFVNAGQRKIVSLKPDAYVVNGSVRLAPGTIQTVPADGLVFHRLYFNRGVDGETIGRTIREGHLDTLDRADPMWRGRTAAAAVREFMYDPRDPSRYHVTPPQPADANTCGYVQIAYSANPPEIEHTEAVITLDDIYEDALFQYAIHRAYSRPNDGVAPTSAKAKSDAAYAAFLQALGLKDAGETATEPAGS